ncbi:MAG: tryptophan synthase subunit alpha [Acidiphilium sp.]
MSRIAAAFARLKAENRAGLIPFVEAFDPDRATSATLLAGMAERGADIIEIGMPFTDPMADGPTIQRAGRRALKAGATLAGTLGLVRDFRTTNDTVPLVLMGYLNPILSYCIERFAADAADAGVDGLIVVDLPTEETELMLPSLKQHGLDLIRLIAPTTSDERLPIVLKESSGFVYYVSITGITGTRTASAEELARDIPRIRRATALPIAVGFGIRTPVQAATVARYADAAVVASALIDRLAAGLDQDGKASQAVIDQVLDDVAELANAIRNENRAT